MKFSYTFLIVFNSLALAACSIQYISPAVNISPENSGWKFSQVRISNKQNETVISANLYPESSKAKGYIQAKVFDKSGTLLAVSECKKTPMRTKRVNRRQSVVSGGHTQITLPLVLQPDEKINLGVFNNKDCLPQAS